MEKIHNNEQNPFKQTRVEDINLNFIFARFELCFLFSTFYQNYSYYLNKFPNSFQV